MTKAEAVSIILPGSKAVQKPSFGHGFYINFDRSLKKSKVSSIIYGAEISSVRFSFLMDGFSTYFLNTTLKLPLYYSFTQKISKQMGLKLNLGVNTQIQSSNQLNTLVWNNSVQFQRFTKSGVFPLLHLEFGLKYAIKKRHLLILSLAINKGFISNEEITYTTTAPMTETKSTFNGSFLEARLAYGLFNH